MQKKRFNLIIKIKSVIYKWQRKQDLNPRHSVLERLATLVKIGQNPSKIGFFRNNSGHF